MQILAIDTTGDACSCALLCGGDLREDTALVPRAHTRHLLPMIRALLAAAGQTLKDLDAVAFGAGPGSFTGVRIAASMAQGLAMAAGVETLPISSLAALALAAHERHGAERIIACADARMSQVYLGCFAHTGDAAMVAQGSEQVAAPATVALPREDVWTGAGSGFEVHGAILAGRMGHRLNATHGAVTATAAQVARLAAVALGRGEGVPATCAVPNYLRDNVARTKAQRAEDVSKNRP